MKARIISGIFVVLLTVSAIYFGGIYYNIVFAIIGFMGLFEYLNVYSKKLPKPIWLLAFLNYILLITAPIIFKTYDTTDIRIIVFSIVSMMCPLIYYHDLNKYDVMDMSYLLIGIFVLGFGIISFIYIMNTTWKYVAYLLIVSTLTDTFAYLVGKNFGKHKLCITLSPNKTIEGSLGGSLVATIFGSLFYVLVCNASDKILMVILITLLLSLVAQLGDLFFSSIKRTFKVKDFSDILPGHGGVLDRIDSILLVMLVFTLFLNIL